MAEPVTMPDGRPGKRYDSIDEFSRAIGLTEEDVVSHLRALIRRADQKLHLAHVAYDQYLIADRNSQRQLWLRRIEDALTGDIPEDMLHW